jgi:hypothetical protein
MYNPGTQVQIPADANLGSYYLLKKTRCGGLPHRFPFKKKEELNQDGHNLQKMISSVTNGGNYYVKKMGIRMRERFT